jgi:hypothetical protein
LQERVKKGGGKPTEETNAGYLNQVKGSCRKQYNTDLHGVYPLSDIINMIQ